MSSCTWSTLKQVMEVIAPDEVRRTMLETCIKTLSEAHRRLGGDDPASGGGGDGDDVNDGDDYGGGDPDVPSHASGGDVDDDDDNDDDEIDYYDYYDDYGDDYAEGAGVILELEPYRDGGFGGVPATPEAIATKLKTHKYTTMHEGNENDDGGAGEKNAAPAGCAICVQDFEAGDDVAVMPCSHMFHNGCILKWLSLSRLCPYCRHALAGAKRSRAAKL